MEDPCLAPVGLRPFRLVTLLPMLVLFPLSVALWLGCRTWWLGYLAAITLLGGFGDVVMLVKTLGHDSDLFIVEHPSGIGGDLFAACPITDDDLTKTKPDIRFTNTGEDEV